MSKVRDLSANNGRTSDLEGRGPWGFGPTMGFGILITGAFICIQFAVYGIYAAIALMKDPKLNIEVFSAQLPTDGFAISLTTLATTIVCSAMIVIFAFLRKGISIQDYLHLNRFPVKEAARWLTVAILFALLWDGLTVLLDRPIVPEFMFKAYSSAQSVFLFWFILVAAAPVFEELFFRGFLFEGVRVSHFGEKGAVLFTAILWGITHLQYNPYEISSIILYGIILGIARLKTGSVFAPMLMHGFINFYSTAEVMLILKQTQNG